MADTDLNHDKYASGMIHSRGEDHTENYDKFQYSLFRNYLGGRILEVGAGGGRITDLIIRDGGFEELVISEPSPHFMARLEERFVGVPQTRLIQGELEEVAKLCPGGFDVIFSVHVMEHVEDDKAFIRQQIELLRPGGKLIVLVPAIQFLYSQLDKNIGHFRRYNKSLMRSLIQGTGAKVERLFYSNFIGVFGSLYFSKLRKIEYQSSASQREKFRRLYQVFSRYFIPAIQAVERHVPVPIGLNLTLIATRHGDRGRTQ